MYRRGHWGPGAQLCRNARARILEQPFAADRKPMCSRRALCSGIPKKYGAAPPMTPKTVLIVDDQAFIREMMAKALTSAGMYRVLQAGDGLAAVKLMRDAAINPEGAP